MLISVIAMADEPLPSHKPYERCNSHNVCVQVDSGDGAVGTRLTEEGKSEVIWKVPGWHRPIYFSNDGRFFLSVYQGVNLKGNADLSEPLVHIWDNGKLKYIIKFNQIIKDSSVLRKTSSAYYWGVTQKIENDQYLYVTTVEGKSFAIYFRTGQVQEIVIDEGDFEEGDNQAKKMAYQNAVRIWAKLANDGDAKSQYALAEMYLTGKGVDYSIDKSVFWISKAADSGHKKAIGAVAGLMEIQEDCKKPELIESFFVKRLCGGSKK